MSVEYEVEFDRDSMRDPCWRLFRDGRQIADGYGMTPLGARFGAWRAKRLDLKKLHKGTPRKAFGRYGAPSEAETKLREAQTAYARGDIELEELGRRVDREMRGPS